MRWVWLILLALKAGEVHAQEVSERDRQLGVAKLKKAYEINGNKMCCGDTYVDTDRLICYELRSSTGGSFFECMQPEEFKQMLPEKKASPLADRILTPPPLDCKKAHGVRKDDRCKNEPAK